MIRQPLTSNSLFDSPTSPREIITCRHIVRTLTNSLCGIPSWLASTGAVPMATSAPPAPSHATVRMEFSLSARTSATPSSGASFTRSPASSPSAPSCSSTSSPTSRHSTARSPTPSRSASSTPSLLSAFWSGSSSSSHSPSTPSTEWTSHCVAAPPSTSIPGPATGDTSPSASPASSPSPTSSSTSGVSASAESCCRSIPALPSTRFRSSCTIPGCSPSTSSP